MKNIFIVGAGGSLGQSLILKLNTKLNKVTALDLNFINHYENINYITDDFDKIDFESYIDNCDVFIYLLSRMLPGNSNFDSLCNDVNSYLKFLNQLNGYKNKKIIFISSGGSVYGNTLNHPIEEHIETNPISLYGHQKKILETLSSTFNSFSNSRLYTLRIANAYGDYFKLNRNHGLIPTLLQASIKNKTIDIWGDGGIVKDYIHNEDISDACSKLIDYDGNEFIMNLGSGKGYSVNEIIEIINKVSKKTIKVNYLPVKNYDVNYNVLSNSLISKELDWSPKVSIEDGIKRLYEKFII